MHDVQQLDYCNEASRPAGATLQDHIGIRTVFRTHRADTLNEVSRSLPRKIHAGLSYLLAGRSALMMGAGPIGLFARTRPDLETPDVQFHFLAGSSAKAGGEMHPYPGCTLVTSPCRPESRGTILVRSPDPAAPPEIRANYLSTAEDRRVALEGLKITRESFAAPALQAVVHAETLPGAERQSDEALMDYISATAGSSFHPTSTCTMGTGPDSVVDPGLRVHGIEGLRVADASIMPSLISGNTNAPSIMIGEKAAALILGEPPLAG